MRVVTLPALFLALAAVALADENKDDKPATKAAPLIRLGPRSMRQPPAKHTGARAGMHHCVAADSLADGEERAVPRRMRSVHGSVQS